MADLETAEKGLTELAEYLSAKMSIAGIGKGAEVFGFWYRSVEDARELLKKREAVEPRLNENHLYVSDAFMCGSCGHYLKFHARFCEACGREVKWERMAELVPLMKSEGKEP